MHSYVGYCRSQLDCLILFEAACMGLIPRISQRLTEDERSEIKSGSIYIWDENEAGVKRWTDGKSWSTSRVSGPFLIYRELETGPSQSSSRCQVKPYGLCKQSASITVGDNTKLHLIAYYKKEDVRAGTLLQPSMDSRFKDITAFLKKRNVGLSSPDATPPPMSPSHMAKAPMAMAPMPQMAMAPQPMAMAPQPPHTAGYPMIPMYSPPQQVTSPHPLQRAHTPVRVMYAHPHGSRGSQGPPSPPYVHRGHTPPLMRPKQQIHQLPHPANIAAPAEAPGRSFDEDRRQLSLLDKSLSAY